MTLTLIQSAFILSSILSFIHSFVLSFVFSFISLLHSLFLKKIPPHLLPFQAFPKNGYLSLSSLVHSHLALALLGSHF